jgi:fibro-slime domain-containing protein
MNSNVMMRRAVLSLTVVAGLAAAVMAGGNGNGNGNSGSSGSGGTTDPYSSLPVKVTLNGVVRDFRARNVKDGHPDFELSPTAGLGHYVGMVADNLDSDGKPVMASTGYKVSAEWKDAGGHMICPPRSYINSVVGDVMGACSGVQGGALTTAANFAQWFRDVPGLNMSALVPLDLTRTAGTNVYVFDDSVDTHYSKLSGFFLVNGKLLDGGAQGGNKNYDFTYCIDATFQYKKNQGQYFAFSGNDDIWVFVDGKLVVDLGGEHANLLQRIDMDRLGWLVDGQNFDMKVFYAQRNKPSANFHMETSLALRSVSPPPVTDQFD